MGDSSSDSGDGGDGTVRVAIGRIVKPHGIRGEVSVALLTDRPERFEPGRRLHGAGRVLTVAGVREHQARLLVRFAEVEDRTTAERLRGTVLEADVTREDPPDTYLVSELVGLAVVDESGSPLGTVVAAVELPAAAEYDLLEVLRGDGSTWLLPAVGDYVAVEGDDDGPDRLVVSNPPEGLIEGSS